MPDRMSSLLRTIGGVRVHGDRVAQRHGVEPADPSWPAGHRPELAAALRDALARLVEQLGRERPGAHPRGVGLHDADDLVDLERPDPAAGARAARDRVRRGRRTGSCRGRGRGACPARPRAGRGRRAGARPGRATWCRRGAARSRVAPRGRLLDERARPRSPPRPSPPRMQVLVGEGAPDALAEHLAVAQVLHPQPEPPGAVAVRRPDAASRRARPSRRRGGPRCALSSATWYGMITCALRLTRTFDDVDPARREHVELARSAWPGSPRRRCR